jgi:hypothetical protein
MPAISATQEVDIGRTDVQGQSGQKSKQDLISTNKPGEVVNTCDPSYVRGIGTRIVAKTQETPSEK